jgi:hypothetical protein
LKGRQSIIGRPYAPEKANAANQKATGLWQVEPLFFGEGLHPPLFVFWYHHLIIVG